MENIFHTFILDDHPLITNSYEWALRKVLEKREQQLKIKICQSIREASLFLQDRQFLANLDLVFLDIQLPQEEGNKFLSGEDIGVFLKKNGMKAKMIVSTTFTDNYRLNSLLKNMDPDGLLVKNDLTPEELMRAIEAVLSEPPYYSKTVRELMRKQLLNDYTVDSIDRRMLHELSQGAKMKDLPAVLPLSLAGIEKRKRNLKQVFGVEEDRELILKAREKGFI